MHLGRKHKWKLTFAIGLFLIGQAFSIAHAAEHGSGSHDHNGVACAGVLTDDQDCLTPTKGLDTPLFFSSTSSTLHCQTAQPLQRLRALRPPATGPPSI